MVPRLTAAAVHMAMLHAVMQARPSAMHGIVPYSDAWWATCHTHVPAVMRGTTCHEYGIVTYSEAWGAIFYAWKSAARVSLE